MISSWGEEGVTGLMRHESTDILYCRWLMSIAHCPGDDLLKSCSRKVEQRTEATSDLKNSPLFYAVLSEHEHRLIWRRLTTFGFIWQTLWWWSVPLCTTARVQTRWLTILLELWLPRRERRKLPHWRMYTLVLSKNESLAQSDHIFHQWAMCLTALECYLHRSYLPVLGKGSIEKIDFF